MFFVDLAATNWGSVKESSRRFLTSPTLIEATPVRARAYDRNCASVRAAGAHTCWRAWLSLGTGRGWGWNCVRALFGPVEGQSAKHPVSERLRACSQQPALPLRRYFEQPDDGVWEAVQGRFKEAAKRFWRRVFRGPGDVVFQGRRNEFFASFA